MMKIKLERDVSFKQSSYKQMGVVSDVKMDGGRKRFQYLIENCILEKSFCTGRANRPRLLPGSTKSSYATLINHFSYQNQTWSTEISALFPIKFSSPRNNFFQRTNNIQQLHNKQYTLDSLNLYHYRRLSPCKIKYIHYTNSI